MMKLKVGVNPTSLKPEIMLAIMVAKEVYTEHGYDFVITSLNDSTHSQTSRHYQGMAVDLRTRMFHNGGVAKEITDEIRARLDRHYLVLFEHNHIHIGYQPRKP